MLSYVLFPAITLYTNICQLACVAKDEKRPVADFFKNAGRFFIYIRVGVIEYVYVVGSDLCAYMQDFCSR